MTTEYVALGDSYAAGVGAGARQNVCWRGEGGYPVLVAARLGRGVAYQACLGATIGDVTRNQVEALSAQTSIVTLTVGGNDVGFVPVLIAAAQPGWMANSDTAIDNALIVLRGQLPGWLSALYADIAARAGGADVLVTGYPRIFNGTDCNLATYFSAHEMRRINDATDELNAVIAATASRAGFGFVPVANGFDGHAVCDEQEWINGVAYPIEESFHPNPLGHSAYGDAVLAALREAGHAVASEPVGVSETDALVTQGPCVPGSAPTFSLPDLLSEASMRGARDFGLDPGEISRLAVALGPPADGSAIPGEPGAEALAARNRLRELDAQARATRGEMRMGDG